MDRRKLIVRGLRRRAAAWRCGLALAAAGLAAHAQPAAAPDAPAAQVGRLRTTGVHALDQTGSTVTALSGGQWLLVGHGLPNAHRDGLAAQARLLRDRHLRPPAPDAADASGHRWDPQQRLWRRLPPIPGCENGARFAHTATRLADGRVWVAGGLCDRPGGEAEPRPHPLYTATALWDPQAQAWRAGPPLAQARLRHSASLMPDGSVLLAGGERDPGVDQGRDVPVLAEVERLRGDRLDPLPPLATARAGHSATVLADGTLLVAGGVDAQGAPLAAVELWRPDLGQWQALPPLQQARSGHSATRLADGRVAVVGGIGAEGRWLDSVEVWTPALQRWTAGPSLRLPLHDHAAVLLPGGQLLVAGGVWAATGQQLPWAWSWDPATAYWSLAGMARPDTATDLAGDVHLLPAPDGGAEVFTARALLHWQPAGSTPADALAEGAPVWWSAPAAAALPDGRVVLVGRTADDGGVLPPLSIVWHPLPPHWREPRRLPRRSLGDDSLLVLPGGAWLHLAAVDAATLGCDRLDLAERRWQDCGSIVPGRPPPPHAVPLAALADGRVLAVPRQDEAWLLDPASPGWTRAAARWTGDTLPTGAPVRGEAAAGAVLDPRTGQWIEANAPLAWLAQRQGSQRRFSWDAAKAEWRYVLDKRDIGSPGLPLADGCVLSLQPLAVYDPRDGRVRALDDPGLGMARGQAAAVALPDGRLLVSGVVPAAADPGAGQALFQASCAGLVPADGAAPGLPGVPAVEALQATASGASAAMPRPGAAASAPPGAGPGPLERAAAWVRQRQRLLLAVLGPLLLGLLLWRLGLRSLRIGPSWALRGLVWGLFAIVVVPALWGYLGFERRQAALACGDDIDACLDPDSGRLRPSRRAAGPQQAMQTTLPCKMVGVWSSRRGREIHRIALHGDGRYAMQDLPATGYWAVQGAHLLWRHREGPMRDLDINPLLPGDVEDRFTLVEGDGSHTVFERLQPLPDEKCTPS